MAPRIDHRAAEPDDIPWLTETYVVALRDAITEVRGGWDEHRERTQFVAQLRLPDTWILRHGDEAVGLHTAWPEPDHWFLGSLCIAVAHQNRGYGAAAMRELARRAGGLPVRLSVLISNRAARRFYERLGCRYLASTRAHDHFQWDPAAC